MWLSDRLGYSVRHILNVPAVHSLARSNICSFTSSIISSLNHWPSHLYTHLFIPPCVLTKGYHALKQGSREHDQCLISGHVTSESNTYSSMCVRVFFRGKKKGVHEQCTYFLLKLKTSLHIALDCLFLGRWDEKSLILHIFTLYFDFSAV